MIKHLEPNMMIYIPSQAIETSPHNSHPSVYGGECIRYLSTSCIPCLDKGCPFTKNVTYQWCLDETQTWKLDYGPMNSKEIVILWSYEKSGHVLMGNKFA
mgnify:FL=1